MNSTPHWPRDLFLISRHDTRHGAQASPKSMGSKAFNLTRMLGCGLNVPPALVIGSRFTAHPDECVPAVLETGLPALESVTGMVFGDSRKPLIVSVRSGAAVSMPGMMETLLNIGLCDETLPGLLRQTGNPRMVWDAYRRLIASYGEVVAGLPAGLFEDEIARVTAGRDERLLDFAEMRSLARTFLEIYAAQARQPFPQDVREQLIGAMQAVFSSWHSDKATAYRQINRIDAKLGTAVTIQSMVFGNSGNRSGAGVGFTRDPSTGERRLWVDFLTNAQGEDVVSGRRNAHGHEALAAVAPEAWKKLEESTAILERDFGDMQDFEFTVQEGTLYLLQTRSGKRTPIAAARIALDLLDEGTIDRATALARTEGLKNSDLQSVRLESCDEVSLDEAHLASAMTACAGIVSGEVLLNPDHAARAHAEGRKVILVRQDAETNDIAAIESAEGLLTQRGARTSHAAVVARQLGKVCLVGCTTLKINASDNTIQFGEMQLREGDFLTLDGNSGDVYRGEIARVRVDETALQKRLETLRHDSDRGRKASARAAGTKTTGKAHPRKKGK
ncbi:MAG: PEP/pyruvate-binding domain-containing protein [Burkholderiales bacterium]